MPETQLTIVERSLTRLRAEMRWLECAVTKEDREEIKERIAYFSAWPTDLLYQRFMMYLLTLADQKETSSERNEETYQQFTRGADTDA